MYRKLVVAAALLLGLGVGALAAENPPLDTLLHSKSQPGHATLERGRYLVKAGDCEACHTAPNGKSFAGGRVIPTPFGNLYSTNITPDRGTGIGKWTLQDFYRAMHSGIDRQGNHLYPGFPYPWYTKVTGDDVKAIKAYLDTVKPVRKLNRPPGMSWPFTMRSGLAIWNKLYFDQGTFVGDPQKSAQWNRGAYLVRGLGHCGACHTAKNFAGATKASVAMQGGFGENAFAPNLAGGLRDGLGGWSVAEIVEYLKTGSNDKSSAAGPMAEVVNDDTQYLTNADLTAIATYLKDLPRMEPDAGSVADADVMKRGGGVYDDNCTGCHMEGGQGQKGVFPPLKGSSAIQAQHAETLVRIVLDGATVPATPMKPTGFQMPAFKEKLDDAQIAAVLSYIRSAWGNHAGAVSTGDVANVRDQMKQQKGVP
ncbi:MAG: c-type cytochrome [Rhodanobacteraceae bacterium]